MTIPGSANPLLLASKQQYLVQRSIRFNSSDSGYCAFTPGSVGNRKTFTFSAWVKRTTLSSAGYKHIFSTGNTLTESGYFGISFWEDKLDVTTGAADLRKTSAVYRDISAWYHIVVAVDTTQGTAANRVKVYVNGLEVTAFQTSNNPSPSADLAVSNTIAHNIGRNTYNSSDYFDGYLSEVWFVGGLALTPNDFGETNQTTGQWIPKRYTGSTAGTNTYQLTFSDNSNTTAATLGKDTSGNNNNWDCFNLQTTTGGPTSVAAASGALPIYNTTDTYGATKGTGTRTDANASALVLALPMDGANNGTTFADESATIRGSGSAKTTTATGAITSTAQSRLYGSSGLFNGSTSRVTIPDSDDWDLGTTFTIEFWVYRTSATRGHIVGQYDYPNNNLNSWVVELDGNGTSLGVNKLGYGFLTGGSTYSYWYVNYTSYNTWDHIAVVRNGAGTNVRFFINGIERSLTGSANTSLSPVNVALPLSVGGEQSGDYAFAGYINDLRLYKGVAKYTSNFNPPANPQQAALIGAGNDSLVDTPSSAGTDSGLGGQVTGNYATLNPLSPTLTKTLANGNLDVTLAAGTSARSTIAVLSGKWYWEVAHGAFTSTGRGNMGVCFASNLKDAPQVDSADSYTYWGNTGQKQNSGTLSAYGDTYTTGDVIGFALDLDNGRIFFSKNGVWQASGNPATGANPAFTGLSGTFVPLIATDNNGQTSHVANFGQRPFAYTAPSGFKALVDTNIPVVIAKPNTVFDAITYSGTGNSTTQTIVLPGAFSPDLVWVKGRNEAYYHRLTSSLQTQPNYLASNATDAEGSGNGTISSLNSNGFTVSGNNGTGGTNTSGSTYVAWCWDAGTTTTTINANAYSAGVPSITSSVRANTSAGFSIVTYVGTGGTGGTVGHGLGVAPSLIIAKSRSASRDWAVYHKDLTKDKYLNLNSTAAASTTASVWGNAEPTSTVFGVYAWSTAQNNANGENMVAYCFAPVAGYSSMGSFVGNGSTDGPFVFTGMRPRWILLKDSTNVANWELIDTARIGYNGANYRLYPNLSDAETADNRVDILSNGFKIRTGAGTAINTSNAVVVYAAFAENPFAYARAR